PALRRLCDELPATSSRRAGDRWWQRTSPLCGGQIHAQRKMKPALRRLCDELPATSSRRAMLA
ncbi:MAG: hypothetical protein ACUVR3_13355, partial [Candidatus Roseilinea sp.]|uniref:hypothetical protein n=1 Tax=Candidatus Roseilinea sp. TaxID=2838777 RepID=UPI00404B3AB4